MNERFIKAGTFLALSVFLLPAAMIDAHEGEEHGESDAQHGGYVMMHNDLHVELVLTPGGQLRLYYTDAYRAELPAVVVSDVAIEIDRSGQKTEFIYMNISSSGDYWEGEGDPVVDPSTIIRIGFVFQGEPLLIDVPAEALPLYQTVTTALAH